MRLSVGLRNENYQEGNTWFSNAHHDPDSSIQLHMTYELYVALGKPEFIRVMVDPFDTDPDKD